MKTKSLVAGVMMVLAGSAVAGEDFATLKDIPAQAMSHTEMAKVEGKTDYYSSMRFSTYAGLQQRGMNMLKGSSYNYPSAYADRRLRAAYEYNQLTRNSNNDYFNQVAAVYVVKKYGLQ